MRPTKEGWRIILTAVLIALAALNTGNNLIYILLGIELSLLLVAAVALPLNLRGLEISASPRGPVYAGEDATIDVTVRNTRRILPAYSLQLGADAEGGGSIMRVGPRAGATSAAVFKFPKRGVYPGAGGIRAGSFFPFIFFSGRSKARAAGPLTVYPRLIDLPETALAEGRSEGSAHIMQGEGDDLFGLREFRFGDDVRRVSWKVSARTGRLMLREFAEDMHEAICIILDDAAPVAPEAFEKAVSVAASLAVRHCREGRPVGLATCRGLIPPASGEENLYRMLDELAVAGESGGGACTLDAEAIHGLRIGVLKSANSTLGGLAPSCEVLIDASAI